MSFHKRELEHQLAEVAAGRRASVDMGVRSTVSDEERQAASSAERDLERTRELMQRSAQEASEAARRLAGLTEEGNRIAFEQLRELERHQERLQDLEEERNEDNRAANAAMLERVEAEHAAQEEHRQRIEQAEDERSERERTALEAHLLATSPCYASAKQLYRLRKLELPYAERDLLVTYYERAIPLAAELQQAVAKSDADLLQRELSHVTVLAEAVSRTASELATAESRLASAQAEVIRTRKTNNPLTWYGAAARSRDAATLAAETAARALDAASLSATQAKDSAAKYSPKRARCERVISLMKSTGVEQRRSELWRDIYAWMKSAPRSRKLSMFANADMWSVEIDPIVCATLDQTRAAGAKSISYPGLGELPFGDALVQTMERIALLEKAGDPFDSTINGALALRWLDVASETGAFAPERPLTEREDKAYAYKTEELWGPPGLPKPIVGPDAKLELLEAGPKDELFEQAATIARKYKRASVSLIQRHLRIGYNRAARLLEQLEAEGIVTAA